MSQSGSLFNFVQLKKLLKMSHDEALMATGCSLLLLAGVVVLFGIYAACKIETKSDELRGAAVTDNKDPSNSHINMSAAFTDSRMRDSF